MASAKLSRESVRWLLLEGIAIVSSILLAFWIEAWWQGRQDLEKETVVLDSILTELHSLDARIQRSQTITAGIQSSLQVLLKSSASSEFTLGDEELDRYLSDLLTYLDPTHLNMPVMESLTQTGDLASITDDTLRRELGTFIAEMPGLRESLYMEYRFFETRLSPFMQKRSSFVQIWNVPTHTPGFPEEIYEWEPTKLDKPISHREVHESVELQNLMVSRINLLDNVSSSQEKLADKAAALVKMIENQYQR